MSPSPIQRLEDPAEKRNPPVMVEPGTDHKNRPTRLTALQNGENQMTATPEHDYVYSYEYGVDVKTGDNQWQPVRFVSQIAPKTQPQNVDGKTYDDNGADHPVNTGETTELSFTTQLHRLKDSGKPLPEIEVLSAACAPDASGAKATVTVRYYDKPADPKAKPDPDEAFEIDATVTRERGETGNEGLATWNWTLNAQGRRRKIANPAGTQK